MTSADYENTCSCNIRGRLQNKNFMFLYFLLLFTVVAVGPHHVDTVHLYFIWFHSCPVSPLHLQKGQKIGLNLQYEIQL